MKKKERVVIGKPVLNRRDVNYGIEDEKPLWKVVHERYKKGLGGRPVKFETSADLYEACVGYFEYVDNNPLIGEEIKTTKNAIKRVKTKHKRPYSWEELQCFLGVGHGYFNQFDKQKEERGFSAVIKEIGEIIRSQQFNGANSGFFKENLISRYLGLADKVINANMNIPVSKEEVLEISKMLEDEF